MRTHPVLESYCTQRNRSIYISIIQTVSGCLANYFSFMILKRDTFLNKRNSYVYGKNRAKRVNRQLTFNYVGGDEIENNFETTHLCCAAVYRRKLFEN